jgi:hypothetical protein
MRKNLQKTKEIAVNPKVDVAKFKLFFNHSALSDKAGTKVKP